MFKKNFIDLCNEKRVAPTKACKEIGLSSATFSCWTDESIPRRATLQRMADYFGVSIDLLLGKEARPTAAVISGRESEEKMLLNEILKKVENERDRLRAELERWKGIAECVEFLLEKRKKEERDARI